MKKGGKENTQERRVRSSEARTSLSTVLAASFIALSLRTILFYFNKSNPSRR